VAFIPLNQSSVAWVALGPRDPYAPKYYDQNWQPVYLTRTKVVEERIVNVNVPGAVTVVPAQEFAHVIDPGRVIRVNQQTIAQVRPVLDPLAVDSLRRAAFQTRDAYRRFDVPQEVTRRIVNTPVVTGNAPSAPPFRRDLARALHVESVPDRVKNQKIQFRDERSPANQQRVNAEAPPTVAAPNTATEQARERQIVELSKQAARGKRLARQQMIELRRQQVEQQRAERVTEQQAQGERVRQQMQQQQASRDVLRQTQQGQREAARERMITSQPQRRAAIQPQTQIQREQRRQVEVRRAQPPAVRHSQQQQPVRPQLPAERRERKSPPQYLPSAQPRVVTPQRAPKQVRQAPPQPVMERPQGRSQPQVEQVVRPQKHVDQRKKP
jgi:hypothetical protein